MSRSARAQCRWRAWAAAAGIVLLAAGCVSRPGERAAREDSGLVYHLEELQEPRPNRVHCLRLDLTDKTLQPVVVMGTDPDGDGPAEAVLTNPLELAASPSVVALINTNPWGAIPDAAGARNRRWYAGQPVNISGLAAVDGQIRSEPKAGGASVWVDTEGRLLLGDVPEGESIAQGFGGFQQVVREGEVAVPAGGPKHPRTAIGTDRSGRFAWLVVVDGRQAGFSEGMTLDELGQIMRDLGCWTATNLDGGGSSVMAMQGNDGTLQVVNSPSDRLSDGSVHIRPVPIVLTVQRRSVPAGH